MLAAGALLSSVLASACAPGQQTTPTPPTPADLQRIVRLARENQSRFDDVYGNPNSFSQYQRLDAWTYLPVIPVPQDCVKPGTETEVQCMRYGAELMLISPVTYGPAGLQVPNLYR